MKLNSWPRPTMLRVANLSRWLTFATNKCNTGLVATFTSSPVSFTLHPCSSGFAAGYNTFLSAGDILVLSSKYITKLNNNCLKLEHKVILSWPHNASKHRSHLKWNLGKLHEINKISYSFKRHPSTLCGQSRMSPKSKTSSQHFFWIPHDLAQPISGLQTACDSVSMHKILHI